MIIGQGKNKAGLKRHKAILLLLAIGLVLLVALPRLLTLNQYLIVDEADRWRWAQNFAQALNRGDLAGTLVGDGYPGIVPVWVETVWIFIEAGRRSLLEGQWIGDAGLGHLLHEWDRAEMLIQQRLPVVLLNIALALAVIWATWRLFGRQVALVAGLLIALDPFYLSDSRVNRAEAVITGLMTLSVLSLIFYYRERQFRYVFISGILGGLSFLTKIQGLVILPVIFVVGVLINLEPAGRAKKVTPNKPSPPSPTPNPHSPLPTPQPPAPNPQSPLPSPQSPIPTPHSLIPILKFGLGWALAAALTWLLLWPAMWVAPLETVSLVYNYTTRKVGAEGVNLFFLGQTYRDTDPGLLFYPFVLLMRMTPLALLGLLGAAASFVWPGKNKERAGCVARGTFILVLYILIYTLVMSFGSHKQDRYLMPIFLALDILAAMGLVYIGYQVSVISRQWAVVGSRGVRAILFTGLVVVQAATVLPHHPYYYSYFNPLLGGGQTAVRTLRIGWGEGMDQVGAYLAAKPNSEALVVATRFGPNLLHFKGKLVPLDEEGRWTRADYVVLYIQQVQRRLDPSPAFIDYFQARAPEKVITLGDIDYAWIYPIPFTTPADPNISVVSNQAALLGYSWELIESGSEAAKQRISEAVNEEVGRFSSETEVADLRQIRLVWKNLGIDEDRQPAARLVGSAARTGWSTCRPGPDFLAQAGTPGAYVESLCPPDLTPLPPGLYTVEFGMAGNALDLERPEAVEPFLFPEGWYAARLRSDGTIVDTPEVERLNKIIEQFLPPAAQLLDRVYDGKIKLAAYRLNPPRPHPGQTVDLSLYWQVVDEVLEPVHLIVQLADSRSLPLGRHDSVQPAEKWLYGEVVMTSHNFKIPADFKGPVAGRIEVQLKDEADIFLQPTTQTGQKLDKVVDRFTIAPERWPALDQTLPVSAAWQTEAAAGSIVLQGYTVSPAQPQPGASMTVSLFWVAGQSIAEDYMVFVHLVDEQGQIKSQSDSIPRAGAYPTSWWLPGNVVKDTHTLALPEDLPAGDYQLVVGFYRPEAGSRLLLRDGQDSFRVDTVEIR